MQEGRRAARRVFVAAELVAAAEICALWILGSFALFAVPVPLLRLGPVVKPSEAFPRSAQGLGRKAFQGVA